MKTSKNFHYFYLEKYSNMKQINLVFYLIQNIGFQSKNKLSYFVSKNLIDIKLMKFNEKYDFRVSIILDFFLTGRGPTLGPLGPARPYLLRKKFLRLFGPLGPHLFRNKFLEPFGPLKASGPLSINIYFLTGRAQSRVSLRLI